MDPAQLPLRDIHLPAPVTWWPPAVGWWLLALVFLVAVALVVLVYWRRSRHQPQRECLQMLQRAQRLAERGQLGTAMGALSVGLKRFAMTKYPESQVAGLSGAAWLSWLNAHGAAFGELEGSRLITLPYRPLTPADQAPSLELIRKAQTWVRSR